MDKVFKDIKRTHFVVNIRLIMLIVANQRSLMIDQNQIQFRPTIQFENETILNSVV